VEAMLKIAHGETVMAASIIGDAAGQPNKQNTVVMKHKFKKNNLCLNPLSKLLFCFDETERSAYSGNMPEDDAAFILEDSLALSQKQWSMKSPK
jgi:hypothetical protein